MKGFWERIWSLRVDSPSLLIQGAFVLLSPGTGTWIKFLFAYIGLVAGLSNVWSGGFVDPDSMKALVVEVRERDSDEWSASERAVIEGSELQAKWLIRDKSYRPYVNRFYRHLICDVKHGTSTLEYVENSCTQVSNLDNSDNQQEYWTHGSCLTPFSQSAFYGAAWQDLWIKETIGLIGGYAFFKAGAKVVRYAGKGTQAALQNIRGVKASSDSIKYKPTKVGKYSQQFAEWLIGLFGGGLAYGLSFDLIDSYLTPVLDDLGWGGRIGEGKKVHYVFPPTLWRAILLRKNNFLNPTSTEYSILENNHAGVQKHIIMPTVSVVLPSMHEAYDGKYNNYRSFVFPFLMREAARVYKIAKPVPLDQNVQSIRACNFSWGKRRQVRMFPYGFNMWTGESKNHTVLNDIEALASGGGLLNLLPDIANGASLLFNSPIPTPSGISMQFRNSLKREKFSIDYYTLKLSDKSPGK